jgi:dipeptidyl aminopeptidase/acylaminoacyl peptidase
MAVWGQQTPGFDWKRVVGLREREVLGQELSGEERSYLQRALAAIDPKRDVAVATRLALVGLTGDGIGETFQAPPVRISTERSPVEVLPARAADGGVIEGSYRKPAGKGPFPAILIVHGGLSTQRAEKRAWFLTEGPVHTRFLEAGYVVIQATFRTYDPADLLKPGPALDVEALYGKARELPFVDPARIVLFGGSGGGSLVLEVGTRQRPAAILAGEPATILFAGMLKTGEYQPRLQMMGDPWSHYKDEHRLLLEEKLRKIQSPVLILSGDIHPLKIMNGQIFLPAARKAGVRITWAEYPGEGHGFYFGSATSTATVERAMREMTAFLGKHLPGKEGAGRP